MPATWVRVALAMFAVAFGANAFAPLLPVYRRLDNLSESQVTFMLAIYVAGLIPALLIGGPLSDRVGRRALIRPALVASALGSIVLIAGGIGPAVLLPVGRFIAGSAVGLVMAAGAAWLKQVSTDSVAAGARRATVAMSLGFGGGPLVAGAIAQWSTRPDVFPYLVHLAMLLVIIPLSWTAPEPAIEKASSGQKRSLLPPTAFQSRFILTVAAWAPWVFGVATISFAALTSLTAYKMAYPIFFTGLIGACTLGTGVLIQPLAGRLGKGYVPPAIFGLATATVGLLVAAVVAYTHNAWLVFPAAILLGASYGIMMVSGLREVEQIAPKSELGGLIGVFYSLTYVGFFAPFVLSLVGPIVGYHWCLLFGAVVTALSIVPVVRVLRKTAPATAA